MVIALHQFLANLPSTQGGLYPIAVALCHPSKAVRDATVELFKRLDTIEVLLLLLYSRVLLDDAFLSSLLVSLGADI